jgi:hypothetical protein
VGTHVSTMSVMAWEGMGRLVPCQRWHGKTGHAGSLTLHGSTTDIPGWLPTTWVGQHESGGTAPELRVFGPDSPKGCVPVPTLRAKLHVKLGLDLSTQPCLFSACLTLLGDKLGTAGALRFLPVGSFS